MENLSVHYSSQISGTLSCFDRVILTGTVPGICYAEGMTSWLYQHNIKIFDYTTTVNNLREQLRDHTEQYAKQQGVEIQFVSKTHIRKEDIVQEVLAKRGNHPGLVHILSAMESCKSYKPWCDKPTGKCFLKYDSGKCLHYYFYFMDDLLGLIYIRVPTWAPFRLQVYFNGHNLLESKLKEQGIGYTMLDNSFDSIDDFAQAQSLADTINIKEIHQRLDQYAQLCCPVTSLFETKYHWSIMQVEYATDIVFKRQEFLHSLYENLVATAIHTVKPDDIATFLGHKLTGRFEGEAGNNYHVRIEGSRIKHVMGKTSIKMYDKFSKILRIETTSNDVSFFKHYRKVEHRDGTVTNENAPLKKCIYSLPFLVEILSAVNRRYLEFLSAIDDRTVGQKKLEKLTEPVEQNNRHYKGFNFFDKIDEEILFVLMRGEFNIFGFRNKDIRRHLQGFSSGKVSRLLKRLKLHGLIRKAGKDYKYYLTRLGKQALSMFEKVKELVMIPALC
jgi:hypothetical protein